MPAWPREVFTTAVTVPAGSSEAVYATLPGVSVGADDQGVLILGMVAFTTAASTASCRIRVRRTSVTGTTVGDTGVITVTASVPINQPIVAYDAIGVEAVGLVYVVTVLMASAAAAGTVGLGAFAALVR